MNKPLPNTLFRFIWHFLKAHPYAVMAYVLLAVGAGFWGPFNSILVKQLINVLPNVASHSVSILVLPAALIVLNFIVFDNITWRGIGYVCAKFVPMIVNKVMAETTDYMLSHSHQYYQHHLSGQVSKQIGHLADGITRMFTFIIANFLRGTSLLLMSFIATYFVNPIFCLTLIIWFFLFVSISLPMSRKLVSLSDTQAATESRVMGEQVDSLSNQNNVRIFARRSMEYQRMQTFFKQQQQAYTATSLYAVWLSCIQGGLIAVMMGVSIFFLLHLYGQGLVSVGDFALIIGLAMETGHLMWFTMSEVGEFHKAVGRCKQSLASLLQPIDILDRPNACPLHCPKGGIVFDRVRFGYANSKLLFNHLSVDIPAGQKVGLVGFSGGGKSSFVHLIMRFFDVMEGKILIDDQDIREVTQDSLREHIAFIPQDTVLFHRSLMDNIRYGRIDASDEAVIEAAKKAHAHEFIVALPQGYDSLVGERGVKLSGGQRQRIAIARAMLKNAPILMLDEATSQLDSVTEGMIQDALSTLMQHKTTIVIAHRLSTLLNMDRILVFDQGQMIEDGTHEALLKKGGVYKQLWSSQVGGFLRDGNRDDPPYAHRKPSPTF